MLSPKIISKLLEGKRLADIQSVLSKAGVPLSWNTLNKFRQGNPNVQHQSIEIITNYINGKYDTEKEL
jgi:hypothetical protein